MTDIVARQRETCTALGHPAHVNGHFGTDEVAYCWCGGLRRPGHVAPPPWAHPCLPCFVGDHAACRGRFVPTSKTCGAGVVDCACACTAKLLPGVAS